MTRSASETTPPEQPPSTRELYLAWYEHEGYLAFGIWRGWEYLVEMCSRAVRRLDAHAGYKVGFNIAASTFEIDVAENGGRLTKLFESWLAAYPGRIGISGGDYAQPLANFVGEESTLRQFAYGLEAYRARLGRDVPIWMASENGNTPQLPQILASFGYHGAVLRTHYTAFGGVPEFDASKCRWVGPDGTAIDAIPQYVGQLIRRRWLGVDGKVMSRFDEDENTLADLDAFRASCARRGIEHVFASKDDDAFADAGDQLAAQTDGDARFRWVTAAEAFDLIGDIDKLHNPNGNAFAPDPEGFWTVMPWGSHGNEIFQRDRRAEAALLTAEALCACDALAPGEGGHDGGREPLLDEAWKAHLAAQNHDITICYMLSQARQFDDRCVNACRTLTDGCARRLASRIDTRGGDAAVVVFNPTGWARREYVTATLAFEPGAARAVGLYHAGALMPYELLASDAHDDGSIARYTVGFYATLPSLGHFAVAIRAGDDVPEAAPLPVHEDGDGFTVRTDHHVVRLSKSGGIAWVETGAERARVVDGRSAYLTATIDGEAHESTGSLRLERAGTHSATFVETGDVGGESYETRYTLYRELARIDLDIAVTIDARTILDPDAEMPAVAHRGKLAMHVTPALSGTPVLRRHLPFLITQRQVTGDGPEQIDACAWVDLSNPDGSGVTMINTGDMGYVYDGHTLAQVLLYSAHARGHLNHRPKAEPGTYRYRLSILPHTHDALDSDAHRVALGTNVPPIVTATDVHDGHLPPSFSFLSSRRDDPLLSSLFTRGGVTYARLWEFRNETAPVALASDLGAVRAVPVKHDLSPVADGGGDGLDELPPRRIATVRVRFT